MTDLIIVSIVLAAFGVLDLGFWVLAAYLWVRHFQFMRRAVPIEGTVMSLRTTRAGEAGVGHEVYHPVVSFIDEHGFSHEVSCTRGDPMWDDMVGTPLDVLMIPGKPHTAMVVLDKNNLPKVITILAVAFALPVALLSLGLLAGE